jgi:hypothetical protein
MLSEKRITIFCGHYGSGKTNLSVNYAFNLKNKGHSVLVADLDIINPFFRTKDSEEEFSKAGIELIASQYANSTLDVPVMPPDMFRIVQDKGSCAVLDVGGDERGSVALGSFVPAIKEENNYEMVYVVNFYRPLTQNAKEAFDVMQTIEETCGLKFTSIVNNSCLGIETTVSDVLSTNEEAEKLSRISSLPLAATSVMEALAEELKTKLKNVFPLKLQQKYFKVTGIK